MLRFLVEHSGGKTLHPSQRWVVRAMRALELRYMAAAREEGVQRYNLEVHAQQLAHELLQADADAGATKFEEGSQPKAAKASASAPSTEPRADRVVAGAADEASPDVRVLEVVPTAEPRLDPEVEAELGL